MFKQTPISDLLIFEPEIYQDDRGYFFESYNKQIYQQAGINCEFVQDNQSYSAYGTLRGLHYQISEHVQAKLVRVMSGAILDVAVDLRPRSNTYGKHFSIELSGTNKQQLFIPRGFAHGFIVLSETALFAYKCDNFYNPQAESGINYLDSSLNIDWLIPNDKIIVNNRDKALPYLAKQHNTV